MTGLSLVAALPVGPAFTDWIYDAAAAELAARQSRGTNRTHPETSTSACCEALNHRPFGAADVEPEKDEARSVGYLHSPFLSRGESFSFVLQNFTSKADGLVTGDLPIA